MRTSPLPLLPLLVVVLVSLLGSTPVLVNAAEAGAGEVAQLTDSDFQSFLDAHEVVMVNFYADWCRFSQMLRPIYDQAARELQTTSGARLGRVDCESPAARQTKEDSHITKYPTLKVYRHGKPLRSEYRGQRSAQAIAAFITELLRDAVITAHSDADVEHHFQRRRRAVVGHFNNDQHPHLAPFSKVGTDMRDDCQFIAHVGSPRSGSSGSSIVFRSKIGEERFEGDVNDADAFKLWAQEHCNPLVREITFENGEELTEEGLPFLILFHDPNDHDSVRLFTDVVKERFAQERGRINFITADGHKFAHPLKHMGKTAKDLPVLAFDTFRHMYIFKRFSAIRKAGKLEKFVDDLHSGKLHHDFHHGIDSQPDDDEDEVEKPPTIKEKLENAKNEKEQAERDAEALKLIHKQEEEKLKQRNEQLEKERRQDPSKPPVDLDDDPFKPVPVKSVLSKLKPSENRYSFHHDEF